MQMFVGTATRYLGTQDGLSGSPCSLSKKLHYMVYHSIAVFYTCHLLVCVSIMVVL